MISDDEWEKLVSWCRENYPAWKLSRANVNLYLQWKKAVSGKVSRKRKKEGK